MYRQKAMIRLFVALAAGHVRLWCQPSLLLFERGGKGRYYANMVGKRLLEIRQHTIAPWMCRSKWSVPLSHAGHNYIGTEHILLGLLREGEGVAARVLETLGADPAKIRTQVSV